MVIAVSTAIHRIVSTPGGWMLGVPALVAIGLFFMIFSLLNSNTMVEKTVKVHAIQPNIDKSTRLSAKWSVHHRNKIENRYDTLTERALEHDPGIIVWPEGGNGLYNSKLERRLAVLNDMSVGQHELVISGIDLDKEGNKFNSAHHFNGTGLVSTAAKNYLVPIVENGLKNGGAHVFPTQFAVIGLAICFDSLFRSHIRDLTNQGAEMLLVIADDSSFRYGHMAEWHLAYSMLRSIEFGIPLTFVSNRGPVVSFSPQTGYGYIDLHSDEEGVVSLPAYVNSGAKHDWMSSAILNYLLPLACFLVCLYRVSRCGKVVPQQDFCSPSYKGLVIATPLVIALSQLVYLAGVSQSRGVGPKTVVEYTVAKSKSSTNVDAVSALFKQGAEKTCGAAAISFLLTILGDNLLEQGAIAQMTSLEGEGFSLFQLAELARDRGFSAEGFSGVISDLPEKGSIPVIAHLHKGHFLVVLFQDDDSVTVMDPAIGRIRNIPISDFNHQWSGYYLRVLPASNGHASTS